MVILIPNKANMYGNSSSIRFFGTSRINPGVEFLRIVTLAFGPTELQPPAGARNRRKATVKIRRNTATGFIRLDPNIAIGFYLVRHRYLILLTSYKFSFLYS